MDYQSQIKEIDEKLQRMKELAEELVDKGENFPALYRNSRRILASVKMLELNISDIKTLTV